MRYISLTRLLFQNFILATIRSYYSSGRETGIVQEIQLENP